MVGALAVSAGAVADDWHLNPQLTVRELYTDNQRLASPDFEEGGFITEVSPAISVRNTSRRMPVQLDYQFQNLFYPDLGEYEDLHLLALTSTIEAIREQGFIDLGLDYTPRNVDPNGRNPRDNLNLLEGRAKVLNYYISPRWLQPIGNFAVAEFGYTFNELKSDNSERLGDSRQHEGRFSLRNGHRYVDSLLWSFDFSEQRTKEEFIDEVRLRSYLGRTQYLFRPHWGLITELGYDDNDVGEVQQAGADLAGLRWGVGLRWEPMRQTYLEFVGGERFYGTAFRGALVHQGPRFRFNLGYEELPTTFRDVILQQQVFAATDPFTGLPIVNPATGQPLTQLQNIPTSAGDVLVNKTLTIAAGYRARRNDFLVQYVQDDRVYGLIDGTENTRTVSGTWTYNFTPRTRSILQIEWFTQDLLNGQEDQDYFLDLALSKRLTPTFEVSVGGRHSFRDSNFATVEFGENRVMAMVVKTWR